MGYVKVNWPESQEWMELIEIDEETGETIGDIELGPDSSVYVPKEIYEMGIAAYLEEIEGEDYEEE